MACEAEQAAVASITQQLQDARTRAGQSHGADKAAALQDVADFTAELATAKQALADCRAANPPAPVVVASREILEIDWTNPPSPFPPGPEQPQDWATRVVGGTQTFPKDGGPDFEWLQVLDPQNEYDNDPVGASGWVIRPHQSSTDFPFSHPFGNDFEFSLALDVPRVDHPSDPNYLALLAPGNSVDVTDSQRASDLTLPSDVLGVEMDPVLLPIAVHEGDRAAVFGRWIIDTGHYMTSPPGATTPPPGFRTEIHPPLLVAFANTRPSTTPGGLGKTRAEFAARPYLVGQTFGRPESIYEDGVDDDGAFNPHMHSEATKVLLDISGSLDAYPKIKSKPFGGSHAFHFIVRPPALAQDPGIGHHPGGGGIIAEPVPSLLISFNFLVRSGCAVEVTSDGAVVNVFVAMNSTGYIAPPLPASTAITWSREDLEKMNPDVKSSFDQVDFWSNIKLIFGGTWGSLDGIQTNTYDTWSAPVLAESRAVVQVLPANIPADQGVTTNDSQPYPVMGWLEAEWWASGIPIISGG
jgi:hypothetical protein